MSKIEKLIKKLCPNGVEYKELGEIGKLYSGLSGKTKNDFEFGNSKYVTYMNVFSNHKINFNNLEIVNVSENEKQNSLKFGDVLFTGSSETQNECGMSSVVTEVVNEPVYLNSFCFGFRLNDLNIFIPDFLKHMFRDNKVRNQIVKTASGVTRYNVSKAKFIKVKIPIPPIEVQKEIVSILEKFVKLEAELEAELEARKIQYDFYVQQILFENDNKLVSMKDICTINQGLQIPIEQRKREPGDNRYFYITVQFLKGNSEKYYIENPNDSVVCKEDDILVTRTGSTGKIITGVNGCFHNNFFKLNISEKVNSRYMYYVLKSKYMFNKMINIASGGSVPDLPHSSFYKLKIPVPSLDEQKKIVNILDIFEQLIFDIEKGLPAEIKMRKEQYEYYRDKLLSFEEVEV